MYVFQVAISGADSGIDPMAATSRPRMRAMKYLASDPGGIMSSTSQPKRSR